MDRNLRNINTLFYFFNTKYNIVIFLSFALLFEITSDKFLKLNTGLRQNSKMKFWNRLINL